MTLASRLAGARLYLDTNILIHFVEGHAKHMNALRQLFMAIDDGTVTAVTSELTLAEALVKPLELGRDDVAAVYETLLSDASPILAAAIDRAILKQSAAVRAGVGGQLLDAVHVATAITSGCQYFVTEDSRIRAPSSLPVLRIDELVSQP